MFLVSESLSQKQIFGSKNQTITRIKTKQLHETSARHKVATTESSRKLKVLKQQNVIAVPVIQ